MHLLHVKMGDDNIRISRGNKTFKLMFSDSKVFKQISTVKLWWVATAFDIGIQFTFAFKDTNSRVGHGIVHFDLE